MRDLAEKDSTGYEAGGGGEILEIGMFPNRLSEIDQRKTAYLELKRPGRKRRREAVFGKFAGVNS